MSRWVAVPLILLLSACSPTPTAEDEEPSSTSGFFEDELGDQVQPLEKSGPEVFISSTCDDGSPVTFVVGDASENTQTGYRFVGDVTLENEGDAAGLVRVEFRWHLVGGETLRAQKRVNVPAGRTKVIGFTLPATMDQVARMGAHQFGDRLCSVKDLPY